MGDSGLGNPSTWNCFGKSVDTNFVGRMNAFVPKRRGLADNRCFRHPIGLLLISSWSLWTFYWLPSSNALANIPDVIWEWQLVNNDILFFRHWKYYKILVVETVNFNKDIITVTILQVVGVFLFQVIVLVHKEIEKWSFAVSEHIKHEGCGCIPIDVGSDAQNRPPNHFSIILFKDFWITAMRGLLAFT